MTARDYFRILREGWIIIVACTIVATLGAAYVTLTTKPTFEATATLGVSTCIAVDNTAVCDPVGGMAYAIQRANIYSKTAESLPVLRNALKLTDAVSSPKELSESTKVKHITESPIIEVTATWTDPDVAADIANALAQALVDYARKSIDSFESDMTSVSFTIVNPASPSTDPVESTAKTITLATVLGLLVGLGLAFIRYVANGKVRSRDDIEALTGIDVLANLPLGHVRNVSSATQVEPTSTLSDAYRRLYASVSVRINKTDIRTLLVVSPTDGEISSTVARGLAVAIAESGSRVAFVDLDFYTKKPDPQAASQTSIGISDILEGSATLETAIRQVDQSSLFLLPVGTATENYSIKLASLQLDKILSEVQDRFDIVVVNVAPVLPTADAFSVARLARDVLIVAAIGTTKRNDLRESVRALELLELTPIGTATIT